MPGPQPVLAVQGELLTSLKGSDAGCLSGVCVDIVSFVLNFVTAAAVVLRGKVMMLACGIERLWHVPPLLLLLAGRVTVAQPTCITHPYLECTRA